MSENGGYLQEQDLIEECAKALYEADDPWSSAFEWPNMGSKDQSADNYRRLAGEVVKVLARRGLLNDLGIEQIRKAGIKPL